MQLAPCMQTVKDLRFRADSGTAMQPESHSKTISSCNLKGTCTTLLPGYGTIRSCINTHFINNVTHCTHKSAKLLRVGDIPVVG